MSNLNLKNYLESLEVQTRLAKLGETVKTIMGADVNEHDIPGDPQTISTNKVERIERHDKYYDDGSLEKVYHCILENKLSGILVSPPRGIRVGDYITYSRYRLPNSPTPLMEVIHNFKIGNGTDQEV